jgi:hypothetical protein
MQTQIAVFEVHPGWISIEHFNDTVGVRIELSRGDCENCRSHPPPVFELYEAEDARATLWPPLPGAPPCSRPTRRWSDDIQRRARLAGKRLAVGSRGNRQDLLANTSWWGRRRQTPLANGLDFRGESQTCGPRACWRGTWWLLGLGPSQDDPLGSHARTTLRQACENGFRSSPERRRPSRIRRAITVARRPLAGINVAP